MKRMLSLFFLGLFLVSCGARTPSPITIVIPFDATPIPTLHHVAAQPALHCHHTRPQVMRADGQPQGDCHGGEEQQDRAPFHGLGVAVERKIEDCKIR